MSAVTLWTYEYMVWNRLWDLRGGDYQVLVRHCNILQHTATHCNTLQHTANTATHCNTMQHSTTHCIILQHTATHCNTLPHTATHWSTLQHTTTHCNTLQNTATHRGGDYQVLIIRYAVDCYTDIAVWCSVLQCALTLQHTATHFNTLQHTATHYYIGMAIDCISGVSPMEVSAENTVSQKSTKSRNSNSWAQI